MNLAKFNVLKQNNNEAFKMGKLLGAFGGYSEAGDLAEGSTKMKMKFTNAYIGHYLRRVLTADNTNLIQLSMNLSKKLPRIMFLTYRGFLFVRRIIKSSGVRLAAGLYRHSSIMLSKWFILKCLKADSKKVVLVVVLPDRMLKLILKVFRPTAQLRVVTEKCAQRYGIVHRFASVCYAPGATTPPESEQLKVIDSSSKTLTRLPYLPDIVNLEDKTFPDLSTVVVTGPSVVTMEFLKVWKEQQWGIRIVVFKDNCPNLMNFESFDGEVSTRVTTLHMPLVNKNTGLLRSNPLLQFRQNLATLKKAFPSLFDVVGRVIVTLPNNVFMQSVSSTLKSYIAYLSASINDNVRPEWCTEFKIFVLFIGKRAPAEAAQLDMEVLGRIVKECRREMNWLDHISLRGPSQNWFDWNKMTCSPALIVMSTKYAEFEIAFKFTPS